VRRRFPGLAIKRGHSGSARLIDRECSVFAGCHRGALLAYVNALRRHPRATKAPPRPKANVVCDPLALALPVSPHRHAAAGGSGCEPSSRLNGASLRDHPAPLERRRRPPLRWCSLPHRLHVSTQSRTGASDWHQGLEKSNAVQLPGAQSRRRAAPNT
jgi:hypothetical protein